MARRKTLRTLDRSLVLTAASSLVAVAAMGVLIHGIMWARVARETAAQKHLDTPVESPTGAPVKTPVRISSKTLAA